LKTAPCRRGSCNGRSDCHLGAGDFFGENAALDWDGGFSYPRIASIVATAPSRLLAVPGSVINELFHTAPDVQRQIRAAMRERLGTDGGA
jgi:CRP-like cAMP-binding protein